jgi:protocatechuate 3,4-dioxygenase beta subunit
MTTDPFTTGRRYAKADADVHPQLLFPSYPASIRRAPSLAPVAIEPSATELTPAPTPPGWPVGGDDLTVSGPSVPIGERIIVAGRVLDADGAPVPGALVEIWQANAAGRYVHDADRRDAPLDPGFTGSGRCVTDQAGAYRFVTIRPGAYPGRSHHNAWRPPHIHFSVIGRVLLTRLVTQMYFPHDPLLDLDPIVLAVPEAVRSRLVAQLALDVAVPDVALGYRFDLVLRGEDATPAARA